MDCVPDQRHVRRRRVARDLDLGSRLPGDVAGAERGAPRPAHSRGARHRGGAGPRRGGDGTTYRLPRGHDHRRRALGDDARVDARHRVRGRQLPDRRCRGDRRRCRAGRGGNGGAAGVGGPPRHAPRDRLARGRGRRGAGTAAWPARREGLGEVVQVPGGRRARAPDRPPGRRAAHPERRLGRGSGRRPDDPEGDHRQPQRGQGRDDR